MKKLLSLAGAALAVFILLPAHAQARGGGGYGGMRQGTNSENNTPRPTPTPTPAPPVAVQGVVTEVTPFAISIQITPQVAVTVYKVSRDTTITLGGIPSTLAALKPGMLATITPTSDKIYASQIVATIPAAAPPPEAGVAAGPAQAPSGASNPQPSGSISSPFGHSNAP